MCPVLDHNSPIEEGVTTEVGSSQTQEEALSTVGCWHMRFRLCGRALQNLPRALSTEASCAERTVVPWVRRKKWPEQWRIRDLLGSRKCQIQHHTLVHVCLRVVNSSEISVGTSRTRGASRQAPHCFCTGDQPHPSEPTPPSPPGRIF